MALAEAGFVRAKDQRHVREHWQPRAQRLVEQNLFWGIGDMIGAADDVGDPHIDIVSDHAQVIGGATIGAQEYEVFQFRVGEFNPPGNSVVKKCAAGLGHREPQGGGFSSGPASGAFFARNRAAGSFVSWRTSRGGGGCAPLLQFFPGAEAIVGVSRG